MTRIIEEPRRDPVPIPCRLCRY